MGLLEKFKNLFTEEVEEEVPVTPVKREPVKRETRAVETPTRVDRLEVLEKKKIETVEQEEPVKEEKFVFPVYFDDKDFEDLKKPEVKKEEPKPSYQPPKPVYQAPKVEPYQGAKSQVEESPKKKFVPSPIISPVYGILDKNYQKEDIVPKKEKTKSSYRHSDSLSVDDIRKKAFGTLEDELETNLFGQNSILFKEEPVEENDTKEALDLLQELNFEDYDQHEKEIQEHLDQAEKNLLTEQYQEDPKLEAPIDTDTAVLARQLEEQKRKLDEINQFINESRVTETVSTPEELSKAEKISELREEMKREVEQGKEESLGDSDLFHLIDSMYDKKEDE